MDCSDYPYPIPVHWLVDEYPHYGSSQSAINQVVKPPIITNQQQYLFMVHAMKYGYHLMEYHFASDRMFGVLSCASVIFKGVFKTIPGTSKNQSL
jgi:hypothetical protein